MKFEDEITVEVDTDLAKLKRLLEDNGLELKETYDLNDIYMINRSIKSYFRRTYWIIIAKF